MSLVRELSREFSSSSRSRGLAYFEKGRVTINDTSDWHVHASVRGSRTYEVDLSIEGEDRLVVRCDCHAFETAPCKHLWATMLAANEKGHLRGTGKPFQLEMEPDFDDEDQPDDGPFVEYLMNPSITPSLGRGRLPGWKELLADLNRDARSISPGRGDEWSHARRIIYVVDIPATLETQHLIFETLLQDLRQDGEWGKLRKQRMPRWQLAELPDPGDRQVFAMLAGSREQMDSSYYGNNYRDPYDTVPARYRLTSPLSLIVVPLIARSGRCFLRLDSRSEETIEVKWDERGPWRFSVVVRGNKSQPHQYLVEGILRRGEEQLDLMSPLLMLHGGLIFTSESVAGLDDGGAFQWVSILRRASTLAVPADQIGEFMTQVLGAPHPPRLELPEDLRYEEVTVRPQPRLTFKSQRHNSRVRARLSFCYEPRSQDCILDEDDPRGGIYEVARRRFILRDREAERAATNRLTEIGLKFVGPTYYEKQSGWEVALTKLPRVARELVAEGWHVEAEGKTLRNPGAIKMQVSSGIDWFELHGTVDFGGAFARLPELLAALKRGDNMVRLDDGAYGILPEEWMKKYGLIAGLGEVHKDHLRFRRTQVGVLDALLAAQPDANFDETFAHARERLKRFNCIEPADPPNEFNGELRPYQKDGLGWIRFLRDFGFGGCLADDMGLGKTVQVLALLEERRELREGFDSSARAEQDSSSRTINKLAPSLVVVPKSLVFNWKAEAARFTPKLRVLDHTGLLRQKEGVAHFDEYDLILTTYGTLRNDAVLFKDRRFDYVILDEAQAIKNSGTASAKAARLLRADHRLTLSGTPVENHLGELWSIFEFLNPGMLGTTSIYKLTGAAARNPDEETRKLLAHALRPFILRRTKSEVAKDLPPKHEQTIFCELEPKQRRLYDELRDHYRNTLLDRIARDGIAKSKIHVLEALLRLRQAALHPGLIDRKRVHEAAAKLDMLLPQLIALVEDDHKVLVFSQFTSFLSILRGQLDKETVEYEYLDGKTRDRQARVERFQNDPGCKLFLISLKAGGLGLNLTAAEYVYLLDPWWNPAVESQAIDRAHRIGQKRQVFAYRIICRDTVEEKVLALQNTKRDLADAIINADNSLIRNLAKEDLELLLS